MLGVMLKSANVTACQATFSLPRALSKEISGFTHLKLYVALSRAQRAIWVPEETWCPCVGVPWAIPEPVGKGQKRFMATGSFSWSSVGCGRGGTVLSFAASCCPAQS